MSLLNCHGYVLVFMKVNADMRNKMESLITSSFLDANYPVNELWQITAVQRLYNLQFASAYRYIP